MLVDKDIGFILVVFRENQLCIICTDKSKILMVRQSKLYIIKEHESQFVANKIMASKSPSQVRINESLQKV